MSKYTFKPYSSLFSELFSKESQRISQSIEPGSVVEHVGSSAVPGLGGKGIIDIAIATQKTSIPMLISQLQNIGYDFRPLLKIYTNLLNIKNYFKCLYER